MADKPKSLYEILGVERTASAEEITRAYRHKAKGAHPDAGGSHAAFAELADAYAVLSDPDARAHYDATGKAERPSIDGGMDAVLTALDHMLKHILSSDDPTLDRLESVNIVKQLKNMTNASLRLAEEMRAKTVRFIDRAERIKDRFTMKTQEQEEANPFRLLLAKRIDDLRADMESFDKSTQTLNKVLRLLDDANFRVDMLLGHHQLFYPQTGFYSSTVTS